MAGVSILSKDETLIPKIRKFLLENDSYSQLADYLNVSLSTVYYWMDNDVCKIKSLYLLDKNNSLIKEAEATLRKCINQDDDLRVAYQASSFALSRLDKARWSETIQHEVKHKYDDMDDEQVRKMLEARLSQLRIIDGEVLDTTLDDSTKLLNASDEEA